MFRKQLYTVWKGMRARCNNPNHSSYHNYGGRGIGVDPEWDDFENFYSWALENGYNGRLHVDRKNNDGNYSPDNCRLVPPKENTNNTRTNLIVSAFGEEKTASQWAEDIRCAVQANTLYQRLESGWDAEKAIITPSKRHSTRRPATFDWYQSVAETTAIYPNKGELGGLEYAVLGLCSEAGEVAGKVKKIIRDDDGILSQEKRKQLISELSDVLWYCAAVASELGMSLGKIAEDNLKKLADRAERGVIGGSGDDR